MRHAAVLVRFRWGKGPITGAALALTAWFSPATLHAETKLSTDFTLAGGKRLASDRGLFAFGIYTDVLFGPRPETQHATVYGGPFFLVEAEKHNRGVFAGGGSLLLRGFPLKELTSTELSLGFMRTRADDEPSQSGAIARLSAGLWGPPDIAIQLLSVRAFVEYRELFPNDQAPRRRELLGGIQLNPVLPFVGLVALVWIASSSEAPAMWGH